MENSFYILPSDHLSTRKVRVFEVSAYPVFAQPRINCKGYREKHKSAVQLAFVSSSNTNSIKIDLLCFQRLIIVNLTLAPIDIAFDILPPLHTLHNS